MTVLVPHDPGCRWGRFEGTVNARGEVLTGGVKPGHSDAAKRFSDCYNLHRAAGQVRGWIAVRYLDGSSDGSVYDSRAGAVADRWPWEDEYFYCSLHVPSMSVCAAESLLRTKRILSEMERGHTDRDAPQGGREVILHNGFDEIERQLRAVQSGQGTIAMGYRKGKSTR